MMASISARISSLFCDSTEFNKSSQLYNDALESSGCNKNIQYEKNQNQKTKKNRSRNIIWFNPPFSQNVQTNVAKSFLRLIDKHFPKSHKLYKIFNRNNLKVSYSCTTNMANIIKNHNRKILNERDEIDNRRTCNCKNKNLRPLDTQALLLNTMETSSATTNVCN